MPPTAVALGFTLWQLEYRPRAQKKQVPQNTLNGTITRSPGLRFCTDGPTWSTTPMNSWPNVIPTRVSGIMPWYRCRTEPQIAARVTRTSASLGCSIAGMSFSSTRTRYGPRYTIARMLTSSEATPVQAIERGGDPWRYWQTCLRGGRGGVAPCHLGSVILVLQNGRDPSRS